MEIKTAIQQAWRSFWRLKKNRSEPFWARGLIAGLLAIGVWLGFTVLTQVGVLQMEVKDQGLKLALWWSLLWISLCIAYTILAAIAVLERLLPAAQIERISPVRGWRAALFVNVLVIGAALLGDLLGILLVSKLYHFDAWGIFTSIPRTLGSFLKFLLSVALLNGIFLSARLKRQALQHQATEAQLRLLQAQIEPHFLFNTLANVHSLMDYDTPRAKHMLEIFSDYLRCNLLQLRQADSTLGAELEMAQNYLQLLQIRMGERLQFRIDANEAARAAILPPLLLQPLVENAIQHGLEPKLEGGSVCLQAIVDCGRLQLSVSDDGLGLKETHPQPGHGLALANIRARLHSRYGQQASLELLPQAPGACAQLSLPYASKA